MTTFIDIHTVQNVPPSCINRDESGTPKSAMYGGVRRLRVSSQAWKRSTRTLFPQYLDGENLGYRTVLLPQLLTGIMQERHPEFAEDAEKTALALLKAAGIKIKNLVNKKEEEEKLGSGYLVFLSKRQCEEAVDYAAKCLETGEKIAAKEIKKILNEEHSADLSLFGRMVADDTSLNVDASCQVAHAISTHASETEFDFFTAVDDYKAASDAVDAGAEMLGTVEYSSGTLYRYATINLDMLADNLGKDDVAVETVKAFLQAFVRSMPTGKQNTFANRTLPEMVMVSIRRDQPSSLVGAFEKPVRATETSGYVQASIDALVAYDQAQQKQYGADGARRLVCVNEAYAQPFTSHAQTYEQMPFDALVNTAASIASDSLPKE